jgi:hypothetical protein
MTQAEQYDLLTTCINKLMRIRAALEVDGHLDYDDTKLEVPLNPLIIFSDGSREIKE